MGDLKSALFLVVVCVSVFAAEARKLGTEEQQQQTLQLQYHKGPLLPSEMQVHVIWYGTFSPSQRSIIADFVQSLRPLPSTAAAPAEPSVSTWWRTIRLYGVAESSAASASEKGSLGSQVLLNYTAGKTLSGSDISTLVVGQLKGGHLPVASSDVYLVVTSEDVSVEGFCMSRCGFHDHVRLGDQLLPVAWVGNPVKQCPGMCAWPFHQPVYGPQSPPLTPPSGDVGVDAVVINVATVVAGAATNPFNNGFFQGDRMAPLEAVSACSGIYGKGAYPGFPGNVLKESSSGAAYNAFGVNGRRYLLPAMWDPSARSCKTLV